MKNEYLNFIVGGRGFGKTYAQKKYLKQRIKRMYIMYKIKYYLPIFGACALWFLMCIGILAG